MAFIATFIILFGLWITLSGLFDIFHLSLGVISCIIVARTSCDLLFSKKKVERKHLYQLSRFVRYLPWLIYQIVLANIYVVKLALHPDMSALIDPHIIRFRTKLKEDLPLTTFANSITLTPGTITVLIKEGYFYVHSISKKVTDDLLTGEMEQKVSEIYKEN